jgi:hypothetical protein
MSVRVVVIALAAVLAYGGVVHLVQLAVGGWPPYRWAPAWLAIYYASLVLLDPLRRGSSCGGEQLASTLPPVCSSTRLPTGVPPTAWHEAVESLGSSRL